LLKISNLDVFYGNIQALWKVSLEVNEGELVVVIGANGAGKTTLLRAISGLVHVASGTIEFLGERIDGLPPYKIVSKGIVQVPEGRKLFPFMTVQENLELGAYTPEARKEKDETLKLVYEIFPVLKERKNQRAGTLSGGEQQMLAMGRALMSKPKLFLLDEPSLGLAPIVVEKVFDVVKELNRRGMTILLVEQNVERALEIAHRGYVLEVGRIVLKGRSDELIKNEQVRKAYLGI